MDNERNTDQSVVKRSRVRSVGSRSSEGGFSTSDAALSAAGSELGEAHDAKSHAARCIFFIEIPTIEIPIRDR